MTPPALRELEPLLAAADHVDTKTVRTTASLREFIAAALSTESAWMRVLFRARTVLAIALRLRETRIPDGIRLDPDDISFTPGSKVGFFSVVGGEEGRYLLLEASDNHLAGYLAVSVDGGLMHTTTIVVYRRWTGRLYFGIVRPFHHLVVAKMVNGAARSGGGHAEG